MVDANEAVTNLKTEDASRGRPYYEKLRRDLKDALERKRELDRTMMAIDSGIARAENAYLEETSTAGNIIKGFDNYIKASTTTTGAGGSAGTGTATRRKGGVSDQDRIFSRSSVSWTNRDSPAPLMITTTHGSGTPSEVATPNAGLSAAHLHSGVTSSRATPTGTGPSKAGTKNKKKGPPTGKKKEDENADEDGDRPAKRGKVSWSGRD